MEKKRTNSGPVGESTHKHNIYPRNQLDAKMAFETPILLWYKGGHIVVGARESNRNLKRMPGRV